MSEDQIMRFCFIGGPMDGSEQEYLKPPTADLSEQSFKFFSVSGFSQTVGKGSDATHRGIYERERVDGNTIYLRWKD